MTETVLTNEEIMHLWDTRVGEPSSSFPLIGSDKRCFARAVESAVLQSPEIVAMREAATQDAINYAKSFDRGHVAGWDSALEAAIDIVAIHGGSVEIEAAIRAIKSPEADAVMEADS